MQDRLYPDIQTPVLKLNCRCACTIDRSVEERVERSERVGGGVCATCVCVSFHQ